MSRPGRPEVADAASVTRLGWKPGGVREPATLGQAGVSDTAIDRDRVAYDIIARFRCEEDRRARHIFIATDAARWRTFGDSIRLVARGMFISDANGPGAIAVTTM